MATVSKGEVLNDMYSQMEISGLTSDASPEGLQLALNRLEDMAAEFQDRGICLDYNFTDNPDPADESGLVRKYRSNMATALTSRMVDFGKTPAPLLQKAVSNAISFLSSSSFQIRQTTYPTRQARGSGNMIRTQSWDRFYSKVAKAPINCSTNKMRVDEVDDFIEHWESYLEEGETLASYTMEVTEGISVSNDVIVGDDIAYRVTALKVGYNAVVFTITTSEGRVDVKTVNFEILS